MKKLKMFMMTLCVCLLISAPTAFAAEESGEIIYKNEKETAESGEVLKDCLTYNDTCASDDVKTYTFTVDYSATPDVSAALVRTGIGDVSVKIQSETGEIISGSVLEADYDGVVTGKTWFALPKPEGVEGQCTFTATLKSRTSTDFSFSIGTSENLSKMLSGEDKVTPVKKYISYHQGGEDNYVASGNYVPGIEYEDYYEYVATDRNVITVMSGVDSVYFKVRDNNGKLIYETTEADKTIERITPTLATYYTRYHGEKMNAGETYIISVFSTDGVHFDERYNLYVGNPAFSTGYTKDKVTATNSGTITDTRDTVFTFNVKSEPSTSLAEKLTLYVGGASRIGRYTLTSPNGRTYSASPAGAGVYKADIKVPCDLLNYDSSNNAKVNGIWTLRLRSSGGSYYVTPTLRISYKYQSGVEDINGY